MIGLFGSKGFVGSQILNSLKKYNYDVFEITRDNFEEALGMNFSYVINAAMPAGRFKAKNDPLWDFKETVQKTADIFYKANFEKYIHISSVSARCQKDTVYGRHKLAAESIINDGESLIVRLGPMYSDKLKKGVLIDMLSESKVYVGGNSRYAFASVEFIADWIAKNLDKKGVHEIGAKNSISLKDLAKKLNLNVEFEGKDDHQEFEGKDDFPDVNLVIDFMNKKWKTTKK